MPQSLKLIFHFEVIFIEQLSLKGIYLKKKTRVQCPCGFIFDKFNDCKAAIVTVRSHFESVHKDFLPFGITDSEVLLAFLKQPSTCGKQKAALTNFA